MNDKEREMAARLEVFNRLRQANAQEGRKHRTRQFDVPCVGFTVAATLSAALLWFYPIGVTPSALAAVVSVSAVLVLLWLVLTRMLSLRGPWARPLALLMLGGGVLARSLMEVHMVSPVELALPSLIVGAAIAFALGSARLAKLDLLLVALAVCACVAGLLALANMALDSAKPERFLVRIDEKQIARGYRASASYHLVFAPAPGLAAIDVRALRVAPDFHERARVGDTLCFAVHPGALRMRWYAASPAAQCMAG